MCVMGHDEECGYLEEMKSTTFIEERLFIKNNQSYLSKF